LIVAIRLALMSFNLEEVKGSDEESGKRTKEQFRTKARKTERSRTNQSRKRANTDTRMTSLGCSISRSLVSFRSLISKRIPMNCFLLSVRLVFTL
jgi:hypothetical protein